MGCGGLYDSERRYKARWGVEDYMTVRGDTGQGGVWRMTEGKGGARIF